MLRFLQRQWMYHKWTRYDIMVKDAFSCNRSDVHNYRDMDARVQQVCHAVRCWNHPRMLWVLFCGQTAMVDMKYVVAPRLFCNR